MENVYLNQVKTRLQLCCQKSGLTLARIHKACGEEISYPSLRNLINGDALPTNLSHVKTICDAIGADLAQVLRVDETANPEGDLSVLLKDKDFERSGGAERQQVLVSVSRSEDCSDRGETKDETTYHCYLNVETGAAQTLQHGLLIIDDLPGRNAKLVPDWSEEEYKGIRLCHDPADSRSGDIFHLILQNNADEILTISFLICGGESDGAKGILVRSGICSKAPTVQNILLYKNDLLKTEASEDEKARLACVEGSLKMLRQYAYLPSRELERMSADDPELKAFLSEYSYLLKEMGPMMRLKPDLMLSALDERDVKGREKAIRSILKLQNLSINEDIFIYGDKQTIL